MGASQSVETRSLAVLIGTCSGVIHRSLKVRYRLAIENGSVFYTDHQGCLPIGAKPRNTSFMRTINDPSTKLGLEWFHALHVGLSVEISVGDVARMIHVI